MKAGDMLMGDRPDMKNNLKHSSFKAVSAGPYRADEKHAEIVSTVGGAQR
jgi:hypothetical protein